MADYPVHLLTPGLGYGAQDLSSEAAEELREMVYYEEQNAREAAERLRQNPDEYADEPATQSPSLFSLSLDEGDEWAAPHEEADEPLADWGEDTKADVVTNLADVAEPGCTDEVDDSCLSIVLLQVE